MPPGNELRIAINHDDDPHPRKEVRQIVSGVKQAVNKVAYKAAWDIRKRFSPAPKITVVHERQHHHYRDIWPSREFVHRVTGPVYIDPLHGWLITEDGVLVEDSLDPQVLYKPSWRNGLPSPQEFEKVRADPTRVVSVGEVVSLRYWWEYNYYHFHLDVLGKLPLLRQVFQQKGFPPRCRW